MPIYRRAIPSIKSVGIHLYTWGPFLERPGNFSGLKSHSKILNLAITELFYSHILKMKGGSFHTRSFRRIHFSVFRYGWCKNGFTGPKSFRGFRETGPWVKRGTVRVKCLAYKNTTHVLTRAQTQSTWSGAKHTNCEASPSLSHVHPTQ